MNQQWEMELEEEFSFLKRNDPNQNTAFSQWGFECSSGWAGILRDLFLSIKEQYKKRGVDPDIVILQIKEKFGALRVYVSFDKTDDAFLSIHRNIMALIEKAKKTSTTICEYCGYYPAEIRMEMPWKKTLCETCFSKWKAQKVRKENSKRNEEFYSIQHESRQ